MNIKKFYIAPIVSCLALAPAAQAGMTIDFYASAAAGLAGQTIFANGSADSRKADSYGAAFGIDIPLLRAEVEYDYLASNDLNMNLAMLNAYLKVPFPLLTPYIGLGVGTMFSGNLHKASLDTSAAYQGMIGLGIGIPATSLNVDVEARMLYAPDIYMSTDVLHYDLHAKLRYMF